MTDLPDAALQDPIWTRSGGRLRGRDGCRVPLPWSGDRAPYGFSPAGVRTWLPQPDKWAPMTAQAQTDDPASMLELYRRAVHVRRRTASLRTTGLQWLDGYPGDVLAFRRDGLACIVNLGAEPVRRLPGELLLASSPDGGQPGDLVEPDAAVWVQTS